MEYKVRSLLFTEEDRKKTVEIGELKEKFTILAIFDNDRMQIAKANAINRNGLPETSFGSDDRYRFLRAATIQYAVKHGPEWWKGPDQCPDTETVEQLFQAIEGWSDEFQTALKKNQVAGRS